MARTTKKKIHPKYQEFLDFKSEHVKERTVSGYASRFRVFPSPAKLTIAWFRKRMVKISPHTAGQELIVIMMFKEWNGDNVDEWKNKKKLKLPKKQDPVTVEDLYTKDELQKIFAACIDSRDRAMVMVLYESGVRASELLSMKFEGAKFDEDGRASIIVTGKTGARTVYLKDSIPALGHWMSVHPTRKGALWTTLTLPLRPLKISALRTRVYEIIGRAKLSRKPKKIIHMFRHTRATELVNLGIRGQTLNKIMGWTKKSNMEAVYVHLSSADVENEIRSKLWGEPIEKPQPMLVSGKCPRCGIAVDANDVVCANCSFPLTSDGIKDAVDYKAKLEERLESLENLEERTESLENLIKVFWSETQTESTGIVIDIKDGKLQFVREDEGGGPATSEK